MGEAGPIWLRGIYLSCLGLAVAAVLISVAWGIRVSSRPEGKFDCPRVSAIGFSYFKFADGHVTLETPGPPTAVGSYALEKGVWVWTHLNGLRLILKPSCRGLRLLGPDGAEYTGFGKLPRLFLSPEFRWSVSRVLHPST
jgi:hypothetical protein